MSEFKGLSTAKANLSTNNDNSKHQVPKFIGLMYAAPGAIPLGTGPLGLVIRCV